MRSLAFPLQSEIRHAALWTSPARLPISPPTAALRRFGAQVAQLVEHATENRSVGGSIPPLGTMKIKHLMPTVVSFSIVPIQIDLRATSRR